jgi:hypothetical protein
VAELCKTAWLVLATGLISVGSDEALLLTLGVFDSGEISNEAKSSEILDAGEVMGENTDGVINASPETTLSVAVGGWGEAYPPPIMR